MAPTAKGEALLGGRMGRRLGMGRTVGKGGAAGRGSQGPCRPMPCRRHLHLLVNPSLVNLQLCKGLPIPLPHHLHFLTNHHPAGAVNIICRAAPCLSHLPFHSPNAISPHPPPCSPQRPLQLHKGSPIPLLYMYIVDRFIVSPPPTFLTKCRRPQHHLQLCGAGGAGDGARQGECIPHTWDVCHCGM